MAEVAEVSLRVVQESTQIAPQQDHEVRLERTEQTMPLMVVVPEQAVEAQMEVLEDQETKETLVVLEASQVAIQCQAEDQVTTDLE